MLLVLHRTICKRHLLPNQPFWLVVSLPRTIAVELLADRDLWQADILHDGPDDGQTTGFRRKGVNLIGFEQATHRLGIALLVFGECSPPD